MFHTGRYRTDRTCLLLVTQLLLQQGEEVLGEHQSKCQSTERPSGGISHAATDHKVPPKQGNP